MKELRGTYVVAIVICYHHLLSGSSYLSLSATHLCGWPHVQGGRAARAVRTVVVPPQQARAVEVLLHELLLLLPQGEVALRGGLVFVHNDVQGALLGHGEAGHHLVLAALAGEVEHVAWVVGGVQTKGGRRRAGVKG